MKKSNSKSMVIITDTIVFLKIAEHHTPIAPMKNERTITSIIKINRYFHSIPPYKKLSASAGSVLIININTLASTAVSLPNAIEKEDTGTESNTEAEKGLASDSFKRACVNWGIGRELYTAPSIWIKAGDVTIKEGTYNNKPTYKTYDTFSVEEMEVKDKQIIAVTIRNDTTGKRVFTWKKPAPNQSPADIQPKPAEAMNPDAKTARNNAWTALATALGKTNKEMSSCVNSLIQAGLAPNKPLTEYTDSEYGKLLDGIAANFRAAGDDAA